MGDSPVTCVTAREIFPDIWIVCRYFVCRISKPLSRPDPDLKSERCIYYRSERRRRSARAP